MQELPASEGQPDGALSATRRLQPSAVPIWFLYDVGRGILGVVPAIFAGPAAIPFIGALSLFLLIAPAVRYSRFRYDIHGTTLVVEGGLLGRWRRVIPRERIQSIDVVQKLRHRAFGVVELRIEAVGGKQTEAALVALLPEEAERIRLWASGGKELPLEAEAENPEAPLARLTPRDLLIAGITGGRVAVLAILIGYAQQALGEDFSRVGDFATRLIPGVSLFVAVAVLVIVVLILSVLLSIALTIVVYWDFTLRRDEDRLVIVRGLLEKRRAQIPLRRIQAVQVNENFLRRPFGLASLSVVVAGYSSESQEKEESNMLLPLAGRADAWRIAALILGAPEDIESVPLPRSPRRSIKLHIIFPTLIGVAGGLIATILAGPIGSIAFVFAPLSWFLAWLFWRSAGHQLVSGYVLTRSGIFVRKTSLVPEANIQHLQMSRSRFQKSLRLATIKVHIPGSHRQATDLDDGEARRWFTHLGEGRV